jgi:two-component system chemotaxis family response regulator WspR
MSNHLPPSDVDADTSDRAVVLLVDDQPIVAEAVRRMLAGEPDIDFHYCPQAADAVNRAVAVKPTVILQDLVMPGIDGLGLLGHYRHAAATTDIPVIVLSTKEDPTTKGDAFAAGASDYLVKLPDRIELIARIRLHSRARQHQLQRDDAYRALRASEQQLVASNAELVTLNRRLEEATEALRLEAIHDPLSGLLNRRAFFDGLQREATRAARQDTPLAVMMSDLDHFKAINDRYGHLAGDEVIREVSRRMRSAVRGSDIVGRYGGEEFVVLAPDCGIKDALEVAQRFRSSVSGTPVSIPDGVIAVTISVGVAAARHVTDVGALVQAADEALYRAKHNGRNRVESQTLAG